VPSYLFKMARGVFTRAGAESKKSSLENDRTKGTAFEAYLCCPKREKTLSQYRDICEKRLQVLKKVEDADGTGKETANKLYSTFSNNGLLHPNEDDKISHFMLRLVTVRARKKRDWFIDQEKKFFELRWELTTAERKARVIRQLTDENTGPCVELGKEQLMRLGLNGKSPIPFFQSDTNIKEETTHLPYHKVPFYEVPSLVGRRAVFIEDGFAFIPNILFKTYIAGKFRAQLSQSLQVAAQRFDKMAEGESKRILSLINQIGSLTRGPVYSAQNSEHILRSRDVSRVAKTHFPLCMRVMERQFRADSHLKHKGRLYYGKFLKGCGMTCDDQITYYRKIFTKKISAKKFDGEYKYAIRHHYGLEGRKKNYTAQACASLINEISGPGEYHACPYKAYDKANLSKLLKSLRVSDNAIKEIAAKAEGGHPNLACRLFFKHANKGRMAKKSLDIEDIDCSWEHPNSYYNASCKVHAEDDQDATMTN